MEAGEKFPSFGAIESKALAHRGLRQPCTQVLNEVTRQQSENSVLRAGINGISISPGSLHVDTVRYHTCQQLWQLQGTENPRVGDPRD